MDPRLRAAVDASRHWYDDVFALHGIPVRVDDGLWSALGPPPRWHSAAKTLVPGIDTERVVRAVEASSTVRSPTPSATSSRIDTVSSC